MLKIVCEEFLDEMATVYKSREYGILVAVNPDSNRSGNPYFKFYNADNYNKATKIIRVLFKKADYVVHNDGKELWELNSKEKKLLIKVLNEPSQYYPDITTWQAAKFDWDREYLEEPLRLDRYLKGEYDEFYKDNPGYVSSYLEMPDYMNL